MDTKQNQHREKAQGNQVQASKSPLPGESSRMGLTLPAMSRDNMCKVLPIREAH